MSLCPCVSVSLCVCVYGSCDCLVTAISLHVPCMYAAFSGDTYYAILANSAIHLAMYSYYLLASVGRRPAWGKYMTQMQMLQVLAVS